MKPVKDRHLDAPGEANRDKHINFLAEEAADVNPADDLLDDDISDNNDDVDNGFFTNDDEDAETKENSNSENDTASSEKVIPVPADAAQSINDSVPEGDNNNVTSKSKETNYSNKNDDQAH